MPGSCSCRTFPGTSNHSKLDLGPFFLTCYYAMNVCWGRRKLLLFFFLFFSFFASFFLSFCWVSCRFQPMTTSVITAFWVLLLGWQGGGGLLLGEGSRGVGVCQVSWASWPDSWLPWKQHSCPAAFFSGCPEITKQRDFHCGVNTETGISGCSLGWGVEITVLPTPLSCWLIALHLLVLSQGYSEKWLGWPDSLKLLEVICLVVVVTFWISPHIQFAPSGV